MVLILALQTGFWYFIILKLPHMGYWYDSRLDLWSVSSCIQSKYSPNTGKYGPEITPYLDTSHAVTRKQFKEKSMKNLTSFVDDILSEAKDKDVVFLVVGDPFGYEGIFLLLIVTFFALFYWTPGYWIGCKLYCHLS